MKYGSLFSGIGGFDLGFDRAGMQCTWQVEINEHARSVLKRHWSDVPKYEDVKNVGKRELESVDLICGGFPCQDLSVAGNRAGLDGERSGLWFEFRRILSELRPSWVIAENVPGLLSSNGGRDFAIVLRGLVELGYGVAWRILDAQYLGVPQRRRRVFIVGHLGDGRAAEILFESESGAWDSPPSREERTRVARPLANGSTTDHYDESQQTYIVAKDVAACLNSGGNDGGFRTEPGEHLIAAYDARGNGDGVTTNALTGDHARRVSDYTPLVAFQSKASAQNSMNPSEIAPALSVGKAGGTCVAFDRTRGTTSGDISAPLRACGGQAAGVNDGKADAQCVAFAPGNLMRRAGENPSTTTVGTLGASKLGDMFPHVAIQSGVRRLTPTECERLQGFPDSWTAGQSDTQRYKQLGNAVAVPCAEWIGKRIEAIK